MKTSNSTISAISAENGTAPDLDALRARVVHYHAHAKGDRTAQVYRGQQRGYAQWCEAAGLSEKLACPDVVSMYLVSLADRGLRAASIRVAFSAILAHFRRCGGGDAVLNSRPLRELLEGIVRCLPKDQKQAKAITADILKRVVDAAQAEGDSPIVRRDVAMLLLGFAAGLRRVEITFLGRDDFSIAGNQASVRLVRSKASQTKPVVVWVGRASEGSYCPLQAVQDWRAVAPKGSAYLFSGTTTRLGKMRVSYQSWSAIITRRLAAAGIDPDGFSSHSLRAGLVTSLNCAGLVTAVVSAQTRHQSQDMISRYHRPGGAMALNYTVQAGL